MSGWIKWDFDVRNKLSAFAIQIIYYLKCKAYSQVVQEGRVDLEQERTGIRVQEISQGAPGVPKHHLDLRLPCPLSAVKYDNILEIYNTRPVNTNTHISYNY